MRLKNRVFRHKMTVTVALSKKKKLFLKNYCIMNNYLL